MFNATATYPRACPDSSPFQSRLVHLTVGMTLLNASLFEQVDSTFPVCSYLSIQAAFLIYKWMQVRLQNRVKWVLNPRPERAFILQFEVRVNRRDKLTQKCGQVDAGKSSGWALHISLRCVLTPWSIWVACCSHSTCQNRFLLKWTITLVTWFLIVHDYILESTCSKKQSFTEHGENQNIYICM